MPDIFISYSIKDEEIAKEIKALANAHGADVFLSGEDLSVGTEWSPQIKEAHNKADWVFFIATKNALKSMNVMQEVGGAFFSSKKLVPIFVDVTPEEVSPWISSHQGVLLQDLNMSAITPIISEIAEKIKADKRIGVLALILIFGAVVWAINSK
ncbi:MULTISPECIES: toll/interleukin-1 receptor domain-containing protein [Kordiimonas]|jgi:hypothetical protein|uniref:toll/interleukin-1 receptor domain-containing protein n=1 Tax=Kordiimonas TaxID=288021 RepID=UPI00257F9749|nr:toll/interleukin-1 receptor domain-containing protein [Kordiimonas sp. UBA4487]